MSLNSCWHLNQYFLNLHQKCKLPTCNFQFGPASKDNASASGTKQHQSRSRCVEDLDSPLAHCAHRCLLVCFFYPPRVWISPVDRTSRHCNFHHNCSLQWQGCFWLDALWWWHCWLEETNSSALLSFLFSFYYQSSKMLKQQNFLVIWKLCLEVFFFFTMRQKKQNKKQQTFKTLTSKHVEHQVTL